MAPSPGQSWLAVLNVAGRASVSYHAPGIDGDLSGAAAGKLCWRRQVRGL